VDWQEAHAQRFRAAMDDDFNTPEAIAELHGLANEAFRGNAAAAGQLRALGAVLGLLQRDAEAFLHAAPGGSLSDAEIRERIDARLAARKTKNYPEADRIRKELEAAGVILEDGPQGTTWRRA
jgi:cysteinyl-tRNA synthetase